jgi:hypothetical protein
VDAVKTQPGKLLLVIERLVSDTKLSKSKLAEIIGQSREVDYLVSFLVEAGFAKEQGEAIYLGPKLSTAITPDDITRVQDFSFGVEAAADYRRLIDYLRNHRKDDHVGSFLEESFKRDEPNPEKVKSYVKHYIDVSDIIERQRGKKKEE